MTLVIDTFEGTDRTPVLSHVFTGPSRAAILAIVQAHQQADAFLRASLTTGNYKGIPVHNRMTWS